MGYIAHTMFSSVRLLFVLAGVFLLIVGSIGLSHMRTIRATVETTAPTRTTPPYYIATTSVPISVSGVITPADTITITARTNGIVSLLPVTEGTVVHTGSTLVQQHTPLLATQYTLATAQAALSATEQAANVAAQDSAAASARANAYSAEELAYLRANAAHTSLTTATDALLTNLTSSSLTTIAAIEYINSHRNLFTAAGLETFDTAVATLYGSVPSYFQTALGSGQHNDKTALLDTIDNLVAADTVSITDAELVATALVTNLETIDALLATAERDVFDSDSVSATTDNQGAYFTQRSRVTSARSALVTATGAAKSASDAALTSAAGDNLNITVTDLDRQNAAMQAEYAATLARQAATVSSANQAVVGAQIAEGTIVAPSAGVVNEVFVAAGEYVVAGTPLMELVSTDGRELRVSVPSSLIENITVGQPFTLHDIQIGAVDRISPTAQGGSVTVFITLFNTTQYLGESLSGTIISTPSDTEYALARRYVHFDNTGPYITYTDGTTSRITITYDAGDTLYARITTYRSDALLPTTSITLPYL